MSKFTAKEKMAYERRARIARERFTSYRVRAKEMIGAEFKRGFEKSLREIAANYKFIVKDVDEFQLVFQRNGEIDENKLLAYNVYFYFEAKEIGGKRDLDIRPTFSFDFKADGSCEERRKAIIAFGIIAQYAHTFKKFLNEFDWAGYDKARLEAFDATRINAKVRASK